MKHARTGLWERSQGRRFLAYLAVLALAATALVVGPGVATVAAVPAGATEIDGFDDGDASDWFSFGGAEAGGGIGLGADRPFDGPGYLSTGWGGRGSISGFYGGFGRNFANDAQVTLPADPWFNAWVLNQSDATVDNYMLEVTLREDTNGDGWAEGEDSVRFDFPFTSANFDDAWVQISAPVADFANLGGGDGAFTGNLDEIVLVVAGVAGADPSVVEVDVDLLAFSSGGPLDLGGPVGVDQVVFDDMEHADPFGVGYFSFNGAGGGGISANLVEVEPTLGGLASLESGWGSGGTPGFYGGFGRTNPLDVTGPDHFNLLINPAPGQEYTLEINLQDDDDGDGAVDPATNADEFQFNCVVSASGPCAIAGGGWQAVSIPLSDFFDDNSFFTGGNGVLDLTNVENGGNGGLVNIVIAVIGSGSDVNFQTDYWAFTTGPLDFGPPPNLNIVEDFESGVAPGGPCPAGGLPLGFCTFNGAGSSVALANPPAPRPGAAAGNQVLQMDVDSTSFAGFIQGFTDAGGAVWTPQDWSTREGISFWMYGAGSNAQMFIDVLDNRSDGSETDDAERYTVAFADDFVGWQLLEFPFSSFSRKEIGNGAPNDGFARFDVHGWALGTLDSGGPRQYFVDDVSLYGVAEPPALMVQLSTTNTFVSEGAAGTVAVKLNRPMGPDDPAQVSIGYRTERSNAIEGEEFLPVGGTLTFVNGGASELGFSVQTFDDTKHEGNEQVIVRLVDPIDVERGALFQGSLIIEDNDAYDAFLLDDFERGAYLWESEGPVDATAVRPGAVGLSARPGQDSNEQVLSMSLPTSVEAEVRGQLCSSNGRQGNRVVPVHILTTDDFDAATIDPTSVTLGAATETHGGGHLEDINEDGRADMVFHFRAAETGLDCDADVLPISGVTVAGTPISAGGSDAMISRTFPLAQDWTGAQSVDFWYYGSGSGDPVTMVLQDNRAPDPGPAGWTLAWADEFDGAAGAPPDPDNWGYEIGDVTPDGKNGWGNDELQYYTDDTDNVATDGAGNLVITLDRANPELECYYGPCEFESARLLSVDRAEFAYGRIESRLLVPDGGPGLWPAFWSLGTDITRNPWPGAGEIDIMEYVSRLPNEAFGTIHGPGYSGGGSFGDIYNFGGPVSGSYHTFAVEWEPDLIRWFVDGNLYHQATPGDIAGLGEWVFDKPFFLLLNLAIGGNFGGAVDPANVYPQQYKVDYVRVYQAPDTAERFEATFADDTAGWQRVSLPLEGFTRSADQPAGAPDDGLSLNEVWGYGFSFPTGNGTGTAAIDLVELDEIPPPTELVVTTSADSGPGSLRAALAAIAPGGTITFAPALAGQTINLTSGQLAIERSVTVDALAAPGLTVSAGGLSRVVRVGASVDVILRGVTIRDGVASPQGGGVLNYGSLRLEQVVVRDNVENSAGPANFEFGGGGIYNGAGATLDVVNSTVADNTSLNQPAGGIYGFFGSTITITNSTVSGNVAASDVAGGLRSLGNATVLNSTFSGNVSTAWHGGAIFHTDGVLDVTNSTFTANAAPAGTASGILVATFGAPASATLTNNIIEGRDGAVACAIEGGGAATIASGGSNVISDGSCNPDGATDQSMTDALLGPLSDNGGTTLTHLPGAGSPAIDSVVGACPATDQRGVARPQGVACDAGAVELAP